MRTIVVGLCIFGVGCGGQALNSPTSPSPAASMSTASLTRVSAASPTSDPLPFRGELTAQETDVVTFPTLLADGEAEGTATHLGRYAATFHATVNVLDGTATGTYTFTAANGDQLFSTFTGLGFREIACVNIVDLFFFLDLILSMAYGFLMQSVVAC